MNFNYFITIEGITFPLNSPRKRRKKDSFLLSGSRQMTQRIIGTHIPGRVSESCNRRPFRAVRGALESAAGARQRLDPHPIFGPIPPSYYQKMRFLLNPSLLLQPLPN
ncbi:hypothetical protein CQW23_27679 [Capsicum baccatum]|uniref:Uncharacterized protein n=1 Tax=Capsicum baccatum TaxID=33114 RepID=A0A2G2VEC7_CAPBA|nr:hypothetical protein CQW23_27679 [Capsicum baccatum]